MNIILGIITIVTLYWYNKTKQRDNYNEMIKIFKEQKFCKEYTFMNEDDIINFTDIKIFK